MITRSTTAEAQAKSAKLSIQQLASYEYSKMLDIWALCEDVIAGETAVKKNWDKYIYIPSSKQGNTDDQAKARAAYISRGKLPTKPAQTLHQMLGVLCGSSPDVTLDGKANVLDFMREYATPYRDGLDGLFRRAIEQVLREGRYCFLLEPDNNAERMFHINEYKAHKFVRAKVKSNDGESYAKMILLDTSSIDYDTTIWKEVFCPQITLLAVTEPTSTMPSVYYQAKFGRNSVPLDGYNKAGQMVFSSYDVYNLVMSEVFSALEAWDVENPDPAKATTFVVPDIFGKPLDRIPFTCCNASNLNFMRFDKPPLLDQCLEALHRLQADCDHQQAVYLTTDPIPTFSGIADKKKITLSADRAVYLPEGATFGFTVAPSNGLQIQADNIAKMDENIASMGVSLAGTNGAVNSSGVALEITRNAQTADLRTINANVGKAIEEQLRYAGKWLGMTSDECAECIRFTPHQDFADAKPTAADVVTIATNKSTVEMTREEVRKFVEKSGIVEPKNWEELKKELDDENDAEKHDHLDSVASQFGFNFNANNAANALDDMQGEKYEKSRQNNESDEK